MTKDTAWLEPIKMMQRDLAMTTLTLQYEKMPNDFNPKDPIAHQRAVEDANYHLNYLLVSLDTESPILFQAYLKWAKTLFQHLHLPDTTLDLFFQCLKQVLHDKMRQRQLPAEAVHRITSAIDSALLSLETSAIEAPSQIKPDNPLYNELTEYTRYLLDADRHAAANLVQTLLKNGADPKVIYKHLFYPFQIELGHMWHQNKISIAQEHYATAATQYIMSLMYDKILTTPKTDKSLLATCVSGELHEMGIRMICDYLECYGWNTYFLGSNMPNHGILQMARDKNPHVIAISCTMTYQIPKVVDLISMLRKNGLDTPMLVGGYPFNLDPDLWKTTGADGCASSFDEIHSLVETVTGRDQQ